MTLLQNDVLLGRAEPTIRHLPSGRPNPRAESAVDLAAIAGLELDEWEANTLVDSMRLTDDGRWAAREAGVVVARQNGKGALLVARQLAGLFLLGERLQIHSAHEFKTCYEHFRRVKDLIENCPLLADELLPGTGVRTGAGDQAIETRSGNRLRFIARSRTSGVGFSADTVYLDEAFMLDDVTMGALMPTMSARSNSQMWYTSSAPHVDSSVLHRVRRRALDGNDPRLFYVEWGNPPDVDPLDREAWARANPAMGVRIAVDDIAAEQRSMSPGSFARERLGVPDLEPGEGGGNLPNWSQCGDAVSVIASHRQWAIATSPDRKWSTIGVAGRRADNALHVATHYRRGGTDWVVDEAVKFWDAAKVPVRIWKSGPEASFIALLRERGVGVVEVSTAEVTQACGQLRDGVADGTVRHPVLEDGRLSSLDRAVAAAELRVSSDGASVWSQRLSSVEITPLVAVTVALGGVPLEVKRPPRVYSLSKGR
jgi:hypothetical protein